MNRYFSFIFCVFASCTFGVETIALSQTHGIEVKNPRVRAYVTPTRILWQAGENKVSNVDELLSRGNGQVTLDETNFCMVNKQPDGMTTSQIESPPQVGIVR